MPDREMMDHEFVVWLSGYVDAKPDAVDDAIRAQLNRQVIRGVRDKILAATNLFDSEDVKRSEQSSLWPSNRSLFGTVSTT